MITQKGRSACFVDFAGGNHQNELNDRFLLRFHAETVEIEEEISCGQARALVSVNERVVLYNAEKVGGRKRTQIGLLISLLLQGAMKRRIQRAFIADTAGAAMKAQLLEMQRFDEDT